MPDTSKSRAAIRLAAQYRVTVSGGLSMAMLKLQAAAGLLKNEDPLPFDQDDPVWFEHAQGGLESAFTASMCLQDAIRSAMSALELGRAAAAKPADTEFLATCRSGRPRVEGDSASAGLPDADGDRSGLSPDLAYRTLRTKTARVFRLLAVHPGPDVSANAVAALVDLPVSESRSALAHLVQAQLVEAAPGSEGRWRITDRARLHARRLSQGLTGADEQGQAWDRLLDYFLIVTEAADDELRGLSRIPLQSEFGDRNGALTWLDAERACLMALIRTAADTGQDHAAKSLPLLMAYYLGFRGLFDDLLIITKISLHAARRLGDRTAESESLTNLGLALYGQRRYEEAIAAHQDAVAIFRQTGNKHGEGDALNNLGLALHGLSRNHEAVVVHQDAAAIFRQTGDRHSEGKSVNNRGIALRALRRLYEAATAHEDAAAIFHQASDRQNEANALGNLGNVLRDLNRPQDAIAIYEKVVNIFRDLGDQRSEVMALQSLASSGRGGHALVIESAEEVIRARCQCGEDLAAEDMSAAPLEQFSAAWERHIMTRES